MDSSVSYQDPVKEVSGSPPAGPHRSPTSCQPPLRAVWRRARQTLGHASKSPASSRPKSRRDGGKTDYARSSSSASPPVTGITCRTCWISNYVHSFHCDSLFVAKPDFGGEFIEKVTESRYISHFLAIGQIINIDLALT